ncbi:MAG: class I SAM-dependent methyltransferase [Flavisolibacter sp.]
MYSFFQLAKKYIIYYLTASNGKGHGIHSPFVYDFILQVLNNKNQVQAPVAIEKLRGRLLTDSRRLYVKDLGAGSAKNTSPYKSVEQIANAALKSRKYAGVLHRCVKHYSSNTIIELGTSLGLTAAYLATANESSSLFTLEGSEEVVNLARENLQILGLKNVQVIKGNFDQQLPLILQSVPCVDLAYVDGNHRYQPTLNYFHQFLKKTSSHSILVFDDIHWSLEMENAWEEIKRHPSVRYTIDIFYLGFVFFRDEFKVKQNYVIRF